MAMVNIAFSNTEITVYICITVFLILIVASSIARVLKKKVDNKPHAVIDNLIARINAWWAMLIVLGGAILFGNTATLVLFFFISLFALREFITLTPTRQADYWVLITAFYLVLPLQYLLIGISWYGLFSIFIPLYGFLLLPIIALHSEDTTHFMQRTAQVQWGLMISVFCISHVPALLTLKIYATDGKLWDGLNIWLMMWLIIVVQVSDVLQYVCGKLFGKHTLAPRLSPSKTVEGLIGGILLATLIGTGMWWITPFSPLQAAAIALTVCIFGFFGGLVMSAIKRDRGVKDWGQLIQGHGGMLDRIDSICYSAPVFFHILRFWWS